ncbi:MAG: GNAT family N-acetyltransferase [Niastella sp.]|nr:GNAT family N-acetyltransferase [Niastella sp.]
MEKNKFNLHLNFHPFPVLHTKRLILRPIGMMDAESLFALRSSPVVLKYIQKKPLTHIKEARDMIKMIENNWFENKAILWVMALQEMPEIMIGNITFWRIDAEHKRAELGYILNPEFWQQGYMQEAAKPVIGYGFKNMNLHGIEAHINPENKGSEHVLQKMGFVKEAHFKENYYYESMFYDSAIYCLQNPG